jgi:hypothetical protein
MTLKAEEGEVHSTDSGALENDPIEGVAGSRSRSHRRAWWLALAVVVLIGGGFLAWTLAWSSGGPIEQTANVQLKFADVVRTDLIETSEYDGTLGRLQGDPVIARLSGTVTDLPDEGVTLQEGDVVAWIDNRPIVLLYGGLPAWRTMARNVEGPDVEQLESALTDLGLNEDEALMTVDESYTSATKGVVETWEDSIGADDDGVVDFGEVIFLSGPIRVDTLQIGIGDQAGPGSAIFTTSSDDIEITFGLPTSEQDNVQVADSVQVTLPDLSKTTGLVTDISTVATRPDTGGEATFEVTVALDDPSVAAGVDEAPVTVDVITDRADGVVAVPVEALLALSEGGYAVEVADGSGTRLAAVDPGFYADGLIEITGDVSPGDRVVVP